MYSEIEAKKGDRPRRYPILMVGSRLLQGNTRAVLTIADWIKAEGVDVHIYDKSDRPYVREVELPIEGTDLKIKMKATDVNLPSNFSVREINKYYYLPHLKPSNFSFHQIPSSFQGSEEIEVPPEIEGQLGTGFFTGHEVFSHLPARFRKVGNLYVHYPSFSPLSGWREILTNSEFTAGRIREKWGVKATVLYPPVYNVYNPNRTKDIDFIIYSRLEEAKLTWAKPFVESHRNTRIVVVGREQGYGAELEKMGVEVHRNATFSEVKELLERSKNYVHTMTFVDEGVTYGEHFGQSIVEALYAGATPWVPDVPSGALEMPSIRAYKSVAEIFDGGPLDDRFIEEAMKMYDPRARGDEVLCKLGIEKT